MALTYFGNTSFTDIDNAAPHKREWGVDILVRRVRGPSADLASYVGGLAQGQGYAGFQLQTWATEDRPPWATVTLNYVGFAGGGPPNAVGFDDTCLQTSSRSADITSLDVENDDGVFAKHATETIEFFCPQTIWKYMSTFRPDAPTHAEISNSREPIIVRDILRLDNGIEVDLTSDGPTAIDEQFDGIWDALGGDLVPTNKVLGPHVDPIFGTTFFECEDVVMFGYWFWGGTA